jgi:hypothetical protein
MLKLKALATQKKEEEAKKEEAKKDEAKNDGKPEPMAVDGSAKPTPPASTGTQNVLSLRAKGGEKKKKGARQNAAELRAQKGKPMVISLTLPALPAQICLRCPLFLAWR